MADLLDTPEQALTVAEPVSMFERLAKDPAVDVDKLKALLDMHERLAAAQAKAAFNSAFAQMQPELPEVSEKGKILVKGVLRSTYAKLEDINAAIKPILKAHGFAIRHRTEWPGPNVIRIVGILSHDQGHSEESTFEAPMDKSEYRTDIQSMGSTVSYGRRYTTLDLLDITTRGTDDDGNSSGRPEPPAGYEDWFIDLETVAENGFKALDAAWNKSKADYKNYAVKHDKAKWADLRAKATSRG